LAFSASFSSWLIVEENTPMNTVSHIETARRTEQSRRDIEHNLSVDGAARYLVVSRSFLNKLRVLGGGPAYFKIGSRIVYALSDLDEWLAARRRTSTADTGKAA
jgi:hypothetical protein